MRTTLGNASFKRLGYPLLSEQRSLLRFLTCGSADDGKSTLIGRLLFDTQQVFEDQVSALEADSRKFGTAGDQLDYSLLVDGLEAEREQGITIDIAHRFFTTGKRKFIVADAPGHDEYTRNMATGASIAELAVVLVDSLTGVREQTRRHSFIASLFGVQHIILAVNKIDLVGYDQATFEKIAKEFFNFANGLHFATINSIPISARGGDNITRRSLNTPWYVGPTLLDQLESVSTADDMVARPFRFPVQLVSRPNSNFRGLSGQVASGRIAVGAKIEVAKSGLQTSIKRIVTKDGDLGFAVAGQPVTLVLEDAVDVSRGNLLAPPNDRPHVADQFQAKVIWFGENPLIPGRAYILRTETDSVAATVTTLRYSFDVNTLAHKAAKTLQMNEVGVCNISTQLPIAFDAYADNRATGNFILIDRETSSTVACGMIDHPLRRSQNIYRQALEIDKSTRAAQKAQVPVVLWFTGLSASGKSTIANLVEKRLQDRGKHTILLDGDNVRHGLSRDLGFTDADRVENIRRIAEVAKLMLDAGLIVLVSAISPFKSDREMARELMEDGEFVEVFVDTPLTECIKRDPKGLYRRAMAGEIANFTGISSPFEAPEVPEIHLLTMNRDPLDLANEVELFIDRKWSGG
jgi:bifunctional enzyme CysN/CysC